MLGDSPRGLLKAWGRPFTFKRDEQTIPGVIVFLRGLRAMELVNSEVQADVYAVIDAKPLDDAGIKYLLKFDRLVSQLGESYTVQQSRIAYDGPRGLFHKAYLRGGTT